MRSTPEFIEAHQFDGLRPLLSVIERHHKTSLEGCVINRVALFKRSDFLHVSALPHASGMTVVLHGDYGLAVHIAISSSDAHRVPGTVALSHGSHELRLLFHHSHYFLQSASAADFLWLDGTCELFVDHNLMIATLRTHVLTSRQAFLRQCRAGTCVGVQQGDAVVIAVFGIGNVVVYHQAIVDQVGVGIVGHIGDDCFAKCGF